MPKLERLTINNDVIKNFAWPSRATRELWAACEEHDKEAIVKAIAAGADLFARGDHGESPLMMAAGKHDVELCKFFIKKGLDPWAGSELDANDIFYFFGDEERQELTKFALKCGIKHPEEEPYRLLEFARQPSQASFEAVGKLEVGDLDDGDPLLAKWPKDVKLIMKSPKKDNKLYDLMRYDYDTPVVSEKVAEVLRSLPNIELLPVTVLDHAKKPKGTYYILNPLAKNCLIVEKCFVSWNHIDPDSASGIAAIVIDPARTDGAQMFRPTIVNKRPIIVTKELAEKLKGFAGIEIGYLPR
jgi:hypothetical protein